MFVNMLNVSDRIREKVRVLMNERGITQTKLGEVLGDHRKVETASQKFQRASRFFKSEGEIKVDALVKLSRFFERSVSFFFEDENGNIETDHCLRSSDRVSDISGKPLEEIEQEMRRMGLDDEFIRSKIRELRAMEAYGKAVNSNQ